MKAIKHLRDELLEKKIRRIVSLVLKEGFSFKDAMIKEGYAISSSRNPSFNLTSYPVARKVWKEVLDEIDDEEIIVKFKEILRADDKRASLEAGDKLLKLKDRYPAGKLKIQEFEEELNAISYQP